jgi:response regulator NasT
MMESALIVSYTEKGAAFFSEVLGAASINQITVLNSAGEARRSLLEQDFDLVVVDAPLADESGENFSRNVASKSLSQVILAVKNEHFDAMAAVCEEDGVLTISKPVDREIFWLSLSLAKAASSKIKRIQAENVKLKQKIEDIRIIDRAKLLLISYLNLSEQEAHRFIEKQAMDLRSSKRTIAEGILKTYAS